MHHVDEILRYSSFCITRPFRPARFICHAATTELGVIYRRFRLVTILLGIRKGCWISLRRTHKELRIGCSVTVNCHSPTVLGIQRQRAQTVGFSTCIAICSRDVWPAGDSKHYWRNQRTSLIYRPLSFHQSSTPIWPSTPWVSVSLKEVPSRELAVD